MGCVLVDPQGMVQLGLLHSNANQRGEDLSKRKHLFCFMVVVGTHFTCLLLVV